ncbi:MAG: hypothetical protein HY834_05570 [Devosia nanyangense]|uniref:Lipoprotein n=1 Tax=Devosia nanyangense TaxID=1228055 RepID=A0A933L101_9HYPH|nr:hypothetical protein [Devosia nanyangense]
MRHLIAGLCLALLLGGCSTVNLDTAAKLRALDYLRDDVASLLIAFDVPRGLAPIEDVSTLNFDVVVPGEGERHIKAALVRAEVDDVAANLAAPGAGRAYHLFGFAKADQAAIRAAQSWAHGDTGASSHATIALVPRFCKSGALDPTQVTISVLVALPGQTQLAPLVDQQLLADVLAASGGSDLPACA